MQACVSQHRVNIAQLRPNTGRIWSNRGQHRSSELDRLWATRAQILDNTDQHRRLLPGIDQIWAAFGRLAPTSSNFVRFWSGKLGLTSTNSCPESATSGPHSASPGPDPTKPGLKNCSEIGQHLPVLALYRQTWPEFGRIRLEIDQSWREICQFRTRSGSELTNRGPNSTESGLTSTKSRHLDAERELSWNVH